MTAREIQAHLEEIYGVEVSPTLVSTVIEAVQDEVRAWQSRALEPIYQSSTWTCCTCACGTTAMCRTERFTLRSA
jgi:hypothetical protein